MLQAQSVRVFLRECKSLKNNDFKEEIEMLIRKEVATFKENLLKALESKQKKLQKEIDSLKKKNLNQSTLKTQHVANSKRCISSNQVEENNEIHLSLKTVSEVQKSLRLSDLKNNFFFQIRQKTLEGNVKNLDHHVRLGKDLEQPVNELWKILENTKSYKSGNKQYQRNLMQMFCSKRKAAKTEIRQKKMKTTTINTKQSKVLY